MEDDLCILLTIHKEKNHAAIVWERKIGTLYLGSSTWSQME